LVSELCFRIYTKYVIIYDIEMHKYARELKRRSTIPGLSHEHIPNSEAKLMGVDCKLNNIGFRDDDLAETKVPNEQRIFVLGSSITFGWGVPNDSVFTSLLEHQLNGEQLDNVYDVVNSGIGNYNTKLEDILFHRFLARVQPDQVILHYFINDAEIISPASANWLIAHSEFAAYLYVRVKQALFAENKKGGLGAYYKALYEPGSIGWLDARTAILDMKATCDSMKVPFTVLIQPDLHDLKPAGGLADCYQTIINFLDSEKIAYLNLLPAYAAQYGSDPHRLWVHPDDSHPNAAGHRIIFEQLHQYLLNEARAEAAAKAVALAAAKPPESAPTGNW